MAKKPALWRNNVPFGVHTMADNILGVQISSKPSKMALYRHVLASANGFKMPDVIEEWCQSSLASLRRSLAVTGRAAYDIYSILGKYFPKIKHNAAKVSADALYVSNSI